MSGNATLELSRLLESWREEDQKLNVRIETIRDWMNQVNQLGIPHFGETASRLQPLRDSLLQHFTCEDEILAKLAALYGGQAPEVNAFKRQTRLDHQALLSRLDDLTRRLKEIDPPFESWTAAMDEVDLFFEAMEEHERNEHERVGMLMPGC